MIATWSLALLLGALQKTPPSGAGAAPPVSAELRFHRVHLRNGNFIDGELVRQTPSQLTLRLKSGDMTINSGLVDRVEFVKMRGLQDKPEPVEPATSTAALSIERRDPFTRPKAALAGGEVGVARRGAAAAPYAAPAALKAKVDPLIAKLGKASPDELDTVLREVAAIGNETAPYLAGLMETADPRMAELMGTILIQQTNPEAAPYILRLFTNPEPLTRTQAALGLGSNGGAAYVADILSLAKDRESVVRLGAVTALSGLDGEATFDPVATFCTDPDREVRTRALGTLTRLSETPELKDRLMGALSDALDRAGRESRPDILAALGRSKDPEAALKALPHLKDDDAAVRSAAAAALAELRNKETADEVAAQMRAEQNAGVREALAKTAESLQSREAVDTLIEWLGDESGEVKKAASQALRGITKEDFGADQEKWQAWRDGKK
jgi:HEAT repeat protein